MKLAVLSDVHGNVPALEAVLDHIAGWLPDEVVVNGDLISRGPYSLECLRMIERRFPGAHYLKGNHEAFVLACADNPRDPESPLFDLSRFAQWTAERLGGAVEEVRGWGREIDFADGMPGSFCITHASRLGDRDGILRETSDEELASKIGEPRDLFVASHTHRPLKRVLGATLIVNTGSVGQPLDGDPRAAYGRFHWVGSRWDAEIVRVEYDKDQAERDFIDSGFLEHCGPLAHLIFRELRESRMYVGPWMSRYLKPVKAGEVTVADAVRTYLECP